MSTVKQNIIANFAGKVWTGIMSILFVPIYLKFLGIEAYGLIGLFAAIMALISILDLGLSTTLNRELARLSSTKGTESEARNIVRTLEVIYWCSGFVLGASLLVLAPLIAKNWVNAQGVSISTIEQAFMITGLIVAFQWPTALYLGGLMGLQRQVLTNCVQAGVATLQSLGAVLVLWLISPTIQAYFIWQIIISFFQTVILSRCLWVAMPKVKGEKPRFEYIVLKKIYKFAAGMTGISIMATILTQLDKIVLSKILSLEMFGYYILAFNVASVLSYISIPMFSALFPKFSQQVFEKTKSDLSSLYHMGCQVISVIVLPIAITLSFFSKEILFLWIGNPFTVKNTSLLLSLIVVGTAINSLLVLPYTIQLAYGWTKLSFYKNIVAVIIYIPLLLHMATTFGAIGAAVAWIILNSAYFLIEIPIMHHYIHKGEMWQWYFFDVGVPLLITLGINIFSRLTMPNDLSPYMVFIWVTISSATAILLSSIAFPSTRALIREHVYHQVI